ncbi:MAG TPA: SusC/RagA family TonB-linked outer membrane protein [Chitinophagaceae bacterium]|nr:SusC/RagA family TonB-linked outer membrane protein [Chitinophagaceae bacterium]
MKIGFTIPLYFHKRSITKLLRVMKLSVILLLLFSQVSAKDGYSQTITLTSKKVSLETVLKEIKKQTGYDAFYEDALLQEARPVDIRVRNITLKEFLDVYFKDQPLDYTLEGKNIIITRRKILVQTVVDLPKDTTRNVHGKVSNEDGEGIAGATITVEGTDIVTAASGSGEFNINMPTGKNKLVISSVGYSEKSISIGASNSIAIVMKQFITSSDDIVVIGYGTSKKRDIIGSVSKISSAEVNQLPVASVDAALQGKGGLLAMTSGGTPGAPSRILVRGTNSISSGADPLFIVDGIPLTMSTPGIGNTGSTDQSALSTINSNDIESIEVLKDAAATSIYGSRGSNGVILITTKSGKNVNGGLSLNISGGISNLSRTPEDIGWANTKEFFSIVDKARSNSGLPAFDPAITINSWVGQKQYITRQQAELINTDWFNEILRQGNFQEYNLSASKAGDKSSLYASLNYRSDNGVLKSNQLQRYSARINADFSPLKNLTTGFRISLSYTKNNRVKDQGYGSTSGNEGNGGGFAAANNMALSFYKIYDPTTETGYWNPQAGFNLTALNDPKNVRDEQEIYRAIGSGFIQYIIPWIEGLSIRSEYGADVLQSNSINWISKYLRPQNVSAGQESGRTVINYNYNLYANYYKTFGRHTLGVTAGTESQQSHVEEKDLRGENLPGQFQQLGTPLGQQNFFSGMIGERYLRAFFGRADYKFKDRYLLGVSMRRDGSSVFPQNNRWATFASLGAGWIISDESFWKTNTINFFKLRGSFGQTGNQSIPNIIGGPQWGNYDRRYGLIDNTPNGSYLTGVNATNLTWETTDNFDGGIDFGLFNNRVSGSVAYYYRTVRNLLLLAPTPSASGVDNTWQNIGTMKNKGWEFSLDATTLTAGAFKWKTFLNVTFNRNKVVNLTNYVDKNHSGIFDNITLTRSGGRLGTYYLAEYAGVDPQHGVEMIYEIDKDNFKTTGETVKTGRLIPATQENNLNNKILHQDKTGLPTYWGGFTNTFSYKALDLSLFFTFQGGNYIYDEGENQGTMISQGQLQIRKDIIGNTWEKPGDVAKYPQLVWDNTFNWDMDPVTHEWIAKSGNYNNGTIFNDKYLHKGDFVRLKTLQLAYNISSRWAARAKMRNIRISVSGTNLLTFTKYKGYDPEVINNQSNLSPGLIHYQVPNLRILSAALNVNF